MKKLFTTSILLTFCISMIAQTFVSTTPENKNIVLEEFTGIHCGFCPDGHVVAQGIYNQNPSDVVLINIHVGSYAQPSAGEPDFRTPYGSAIDAQAGVAGYPAGTVNRHQFSMSQGGGTAMSRGDWSTAGSQMLSQPSYVNVAAQASIDVTTRELTVVVEGYYTGSTSMTNNLNVVLLQNNVAGPQSGAANYNPGAIIPGPWNPTYNHQHMLRHMLTGQWGELIQNTTGFYTNTYNYTIPADLNGVPYDLFNLEVAVFIAEGQQEIVTGNMATMNYIVPPGTNLIDLGASTNMSIPASFCDNIITPEITVANNSGITVDTFEVSYRLLPNGLPTTQTVTTPLNSGASTNISFPAITVPSGTNEIGYSVQTVSGSSFVDNVSINNTATSGSFNTLSPTAFTTAHTESFEGYPLATPSPSNSILDNPQGNWIGVIDPTYTQGQPVGGYGNSQNSYRWRFASFSTGESGKLIWEKIDFSTMPNNSLSFDFAHALQNSWDADRLQILVSTDCGVTWNIEDEIIGSALSTAPPVSGSNYYPQSTQWQTHTTDLSAYDGNTDVMIALNAICGGGNNLYIDNVMIAGSANSWNCDAVIGCFDPGNGSGQYSTLADCQAACSNTGIEDAEISIISLFPNPANDYIDIEISSLNNKSITIDLYDLLGKKVKELTYNLIEKDATNTIRVNTSNIANGSYMIKLYSGDYILSKNITIN